MCRGLETSSCRNDTYSTYDKKAIAKNFRVSEFVILGHQTCLIIGGVMELIFAVILMRTNRVGAVQP